MGIVDFNIDHRDYGFDVLFIMPNSSWNSLVFQEELQNSCLLNL